MADTTVGFWCYARADDAREHGRITALAADIAGQYSLMTGERVGLFVDRDALPWGSDWRGAIDDFLGRTAFFVPVVTPTMLRRPECVREVKVIARRARTLGVDGLVLPIRYVEPRVETDTAESELLHFIDRFTFSDWRDLRFEERHATPYRRAVAALAAHMVGVGEAARDTGTVRPVEALPDEVVSRMRDCDERLDEVERATAGIANSVGGARTYVLQGEDLHPAAEPRDVVDAIDVPIRAYTTDVNRLVDDLYDLDPAVLHHLVSGDGEVAGAAVRVAERFRGVSRRAHASFDRPLPALRSAAGTALSPLRRLRGALRLFAEGVGITRRWAVVAAGARAGRA